MKTTFTFGSVCSGIEAASVAWHPLGWKAAWLSEIEPFPSAVLKHYYADVPNLGDMTALPAMVASGEVEAPDVFCGGTPCQAFSVAGLRKSLDDARGNLSLIFCEIANAIDNVRHTREEPPVIVFWENVPGVLNTKDNAFGCFLAGLAGEDDPLVPSGDKWTNAGVVHGSKRTVAWRVLDAQYFGVAQRRRRVFVVASARDGFDPAAVLFESEGVRRDTAPSRQARQDIAGTFKACSSSGGGSNSADHAAAGYMQPYQVANCLTQRMHKGMNSDCNEGQTPVLAPIALAENTIGRQPQNGGNGEGFTVGGPMYTLNATGVHGVVQPRAIHENQRAELTLNDTAGAIKCAGGKPGQGYPAAMIGMQVRRLTPVECERLQGFPDGYTNIPWRKKDESPDGPRYKALGNSWAVPVVRWIGQRIAKEAFK